MGLFDFLKSKGEEKPVQKAASKPAANNDFFKSKPAQTATPTAAPKAAAQETYTVQSGDSLSKIARNLYGDAQQWHKIHQANLDQIKDPNLIHPGQQLVIPRG